MTGIELLYLRCIGLGVSVERFASVLRVHPSTVRRNQRRPEITRYVLARLQATPWWALWRGMQREMVQRQDGAA